MEANETINSTVRKSDEMHVYFADFIRGNMEIYRTLKDTIFLHIEYDNLGICRISSKSVRNLCFPVSDIRISFPYQY